MAHFAAWVEVGTFTRFLITPKMSTLEGQNWGKRPAEPSFDCLWLLDNSEVWLVWLECGWKDLVEVSWVALQCEQNSAKECMVSSTPFCVVGPDLISGSRVMFVQYSVVVCSWPSTFFWYLQLKKGVKSYWGHFNLARVDAYLGNTSTSLFVCFLHLPTCPPFLGDWF